MPMIPYGNYSPGKSVFLLTNDSELIQEYASIFRLFIMIIAYKIHKQTKIVNFSFINMRR